MLSGCQEHVSARAAEADKASWQGIKAIRGAADIVKFCAICKLSS
jgi:hypothetical protein